MLQASGMLGRACTKGALLVFIFEYAIQELIPRQMITFDLPKKFLEEYLVSQVVYTYIVSSYTVESDIHRRQ
jgi:hypothetical protein